MLCVTRKADQELAGTMMMWQSSVLIPLYERHVGVVTGPHFLLLALADLKSSLLHKALAWLKSLMGHILLLLCSHSLVDTKVIAGRWPRFQTSGRKKTWQTHTNMRTHTHP